MIGEDTHAYLRHLPHLERPDKTYFVTFVTLGRLVLTHAARDIALGCCIHEHTKTCWLHCAVIMPDHAHLIFTIHDGWNLAKITRRIKGNAARQINLAMERRGALWQHESFDHILRSDERLIQKVDYVANNPVRKGLVNHPTEYRWFWSSV